MAMLNNQRVHMVVLACFGFVFRDKIWPSHVISLSKITISIPSPKETPKQNGKPNYLFIALFILSSCMFDSLNYVLLLIGILIL